MHAPSPPTTPRDRDSSVALYCLLAGFLLAYGLFYLRPTFFGSTQHMRFFRHVHPGEMIGSDLFHSLAWADSLFTQGLDSIEKMHTPLQTLIWALLAEFPFQQVRQLFAVLTVLVVLGICLGLPRLFQAARSIPRAGCVVLGITLTGYGLAFELERGQSHTICFGISMLALGIWHRWERRWISYGALALFSLAVQIKIWPVFLVLCFTRDLGDWRGNLRRLVGFGLLNGALLFCLGPGVLWRGLTHLSSISTFSGDSWYGDNSLRNFWLLNLDRQMLPPWVVGVGMGVILLGTLGILGIGAWRHLSGRHPVILLLATLLCYFLPSFSFDYKNAALAGPIAYYVSTYRTLPGASWLIFGLECIGLTAVSLGFCTTLFSYANKYLYPEFLWSNTPALALIFMGLATGVVCRLLGPRQEGEQMLHSG